MDMLKTVGVFGDSILKGIQIDDTNKRYYVNNHIDIELLAQRHSVIIKNNSMFGCTVKKGLLLLHKRMCTGYNIVVLEYGGNDCDFNWKAISERPNDEHSPNTPLEVFENMYLEIINTLKSRGIEPILTSLPPLDPQRFFDWFCRGLNKDNILKWLGSINAIYRAQEMYSRIIEKIALETKTRLVDLRGEFLKHRRIDDLLCQDGTHPSTEGQKVITNAFLNIAKN
ncbi:MAG: SGNH/GDSL hydrolase family protein [Spirochaetaceae bacterium]|jgi:lysophospholipase L1-like esterase|nr:SGNH/GDSL hydrolase family protein [Spirochaetaceae bacterium]